MRDLHYKIPCGCKSLGWWLVDSYEIKRHVKYSMEP